MKNVTKIGLGTSVGAVVTGISVWGMDKLGWIDRWAFEWGDFATLTTGAAAVVGAVWIGGRQVEITSKQAEIAERQTEIMRQQTALQGMALRGDFYDRRIKIVADVRAYYALIHAVDYSNERELAREILSSAEAARFIFDKEVHDAAWKIYELICAYATRKIEEEKVGLREFRDKVFPSMSIDLKEAREAQELFKTFLKLTEKYLVIEDQPSWR
ncbi:hypothetical protein SAMN05518849_11656 [Sphingobium sp. AP50]|uniref:hypothetical protein n=1 Tax=Sphingobium sp. AP50 TaxID=1884369 RepID=UPI0008B666A9|nr:hypothetical protein [Sphingobium sp. AP50]SEJ87123.1 hypothetical protein SAMN05518849_11656 [Sphingobium sp. AP50]